MVDYLIFGGVKSSDYGIYISGEALYDAPKRDVEAVTVPGRNGEIMLDKGRWQNITVTYPAFTYSPTYASFISSIATFRNAIASKVGYQRLEDTFNTGEYRMGAFVDGVDINPIMYNSGATFNLVFNCKPQRFLTAGESEQSITSGGTITNPTSYDASPLIEVTGYGTINIGDKEIDIANATMGEVNLLKNKSKTFNNVRQTETCSYTETLGADSISENGDTITVNAWMTYSVGYSSVSSILQTSSVTTQPAYGTASVTGDIGNNHRAVLKITNAELTFVKGTSSATTLTAVYSVDYKRLGLSTTRNAAITVSIVVSYDATNDTIDLTTSYTYTAYDANDFTMSDRYLEIKSAAVESTQTILGNPTYIDCDLGECYKIENGTVVSLNRYIDLGSDLPVLAPGSNSITYDNTVTDLKVVPNWWRL